MTINFYNFSFPNSSIKPKKQEHVEVMKVHENFMGLIIGTGGKTAFDLGKDHEVKVEFNRREMVGKMCPLYIKSPSGNVKECLAVKAKVEKIVSTKTRTLKYNTIVNVKKILKK
jgi:hypothetical protein